jgi:hypothetical protein
MGAELMPGSLSRGSSSTRCARGSGRPR